MTPCHNILKTQAQGQGGVALPCLCAESRLQAQITHSKAELCQLLLQRKQLCAVRQPYSDGAAAQKGLRKLLPLRLQMAAQTVNQYGSAALIPEDPKAVQHRRGRLAAFRGKKIVKTPNRRMTSFL